MRNILIFIVLIFIVSCQNNNKDYDTFHPVDISYIKSIKYDGITIEKTISKNNILKTVYERTPYQLMVDSIEKNEYGQRRNYDSINYLLSKETVEGVRKILVLRDDTFKGKRAIVYYCNELDGQLGYWLAIKDSTSNKWGKYYTGLTRDNFFHIKIKSTISLFFNDSIIQLEAALVRINKPAILLLNGTEYECVEDNLLLKININKIKIDSDNDGLTDIAEKKYMTDPNDPDTDGDGINDNKDKNPLYESEDDDFSILINYLLSGDKIPRDKYFYLDFKTPNFKYVEPNDSNRITTLVVNDNDVKHFNPIKNTYIIIDQEDYSDLNDNFSFPNILHFNIDNSFGVIYKVTISGNECTSWGVSYIVIKTKKGWLIKEESSWIV